MGIVGIILLVAFVVVCVFLVLLILVQDEGNNGMGGILGGRGTAAFGSHSAGVPPFLRRFFLPSRLFLQCLIKNRNLKTI